MVGDRCEKIDKGDENRTHNKPSSEQYERKKKFRVYIQFVVIGECGL